MLKSLPFLPLFFLFVTAVSNAPAYRTPRQGKDFALFFAVKEYDQPKIWPNLKNPIRDAKAITRVLQDKYGFEPPEIYENPTKEKIQEVLYLWQQKKFEPDAQLFVFFTGHGDFNEVSKKGFFIPRDGLGNDRYGNSYISYPDLERDISAIPCRHILLGLDACYSGAFDPGIALGKNPHRPGETDETIRQRRIGDKLRDQSRFVFTSGDKRRTSDGIEHSPLTERLLKILNSGDPETGFITADELKAAMQKITPKPPFLTFEGHETDGDFLLIDKVFRSNIPNTDLTDWNVAKAKNTTEAYAEYLRKHNNGDFAEAAQAKIAALRTPPTNEISSENKNMPDDSLGLIFVRGGTFKMGCTNREQDCEKNEKPVHDVTLSNFYIGQYEVTQALWTRIMGSNPSRFKGCDQCPVEQVSWNDIQDFLKKLNEKYPGHAYRLPTEAEWEYAARGGIYDRTSTYSGGDNINEVGWYILNSDSKTHPVGLKKGNELGLFDMSGNVWEWCSDWYDEKYYSSKLEINPQGPSSSLQRVTRGGSWYNSDKKSRLSSRGSWNQLSKSKEGNLGFRIARSR